MANEITNLGDEMENPEQAVRMYFLMSEQASAEALNRLEILVETLRVLLPGFSAEHLKQSGLLAERRAEQEENRDVMPQHKTDRLIQSFQQLFGR
jgi:hypothetical protein